MRTSAARSVKFVVIALGLGLLLIGIIGVVVLRTTGIGIGGLSGATDRLEDWIGSQVVGIANSYLVPQIGYDALDYQAPGSVVLTGVTFTAPDGTKVLELGVLTVTLAEVPRIGEPIHIERLVLDRPTIRLIREVGDDGEFGLRGLSPIVKNTTASDKSVEDNFKLSTVLRLQQIDLIDGSLFYDQGDGSPPMTISGLTTTIHAHADETHDGWYLLDIESALGPLAAMTLNGLVSLDTFTARIDEFTLSGHLSPESLGILPPQLQTLAQEYEVQGQLDLTASGEVSLTDPLGAVLEVSVDLEDFRVASGEYQVPIQSARAEASLTGGVATLSKLAAAMLGGEVRLNGEVRLAETGMPVSAFWVIDDIELHDLLRANTQTEGPPKLAGKLLAHGRLTTQLNDPRGTLAGSGELHLREGRVMVLPGLTQLASVMSVITTAKTGEDALNHTADAEFVLGPAGVAITSSEVTTEFLVARGTGTIGFDGSLDLSINGGPMEKLQSMFGGLGDVIGSVTDRLVKYRIRGTVDVPEVSVAPLGIGG